MSIRRLILGSVALMALTACEPGANPFAKNPDAPSVGGSVTSEASAKSVKLVNRDVEAPKVFQVTDDALWDGRPSLGGVWVASPDAKDPERVILRNTANGKFVIGALFRRERDNPGPKLQISSDAAAALGLLAGQPGKLSVTALRREEAPTTTPDANKPILDASEGIDTTAIDSGSISTEAAKPAATGKTSATVAMAGAAIDKAASKPAKGAVATTKPATPAAKPAAPVAKPATGGSLIQVGIFSVEANAKRASDALTKAGVAVATRKEESQGKAFWSVTARGDGATLAKIKGAGFADAYILKR